MYDDDRNLMNMKKTHLFTTNEVRLRRKFHQFQFNVCRLFLILFPIKMPRNVIFFSSSIYLCYRRHQMKCCVIPAASWSCWNVAGSIAA